MSLKDFSMRYTFYILYLVVILSIIFLIIYNMTNLVFVFFQTKKFNLQKKDFADRIKNLKDLLEKINKKVS